MESDATRLPATVLAADHRAGTRSARETVATLAARIEAVDGRLNAIPVRRLDEALSEAKEADRRRSRGEVLGPLHGIPVTVKEAIALAGLPWTNGSRLHAARLATTTATSVARLLAAGAIVVGKTNAPEFCCFYDTDNDVYGRTLNPHDPRRTPGGSSGGEAAAIAARLSPLGLGSDLGSSIRQPAAWCGIFGFKPSRDLVPCDGHAGFPVTPALRQFGAIGPMARTAADIALALSVLADRPLPEADLTSPIAVYEDDGLQAVSRACRTAVRDASAALAERGRRVVDSGPPPGADRIRSCYDALLQREAAEVLSAEVDGDPALLSRYGSGFADMIRRAGRRGLEEYLELAVELSELERACDAWLGPFAVALCPVVPVVAPIAAEGIVLIDGEPARSGGKLTLATFANALGLPSASVPTGRDDDGLPLAVQVIGRRGRDGDVLAIAAALEADLGGWVDPDRSPASVTV